MEVSVKYFGIFQECAKKKEKKIQLAKPCTAQELYQILLSDFPEKRKLPKILFAVNQEFVKPSHLLKDGDELALLPPMSGG